MRLNAHSIPKATFEEYICRILIRCTRVSPIDWYHLCQNGFISAAMRVFINQVRHNKKPQVIYENYFIHVWHRPFQNDWCTSASVDQDKKLILGIVWQLIHWYEDIDGHRAGPNAKNLLAWLIRMLPDNNITSITTGWEDGKQLSALIKALKPGTLLDHSANLPTAPLELTQYYIDGASNYCTYWSFMPHGNILGEKLNTRDLVDARDLISSNPDDKSVSTFLAAYRK